MFLFGKTHGGFVICCFHLNALFRFQLIFWFPSFVVCDGVGGLRVFGVWSCFGVMLVYSRVVDECSG